jgi:hypothetical protein
MVSLETLCAALLLYTILPGFVPPGGTLAAFFPGQCFPIRAAEAFAVVARFVESRGAVAATLLDDHLVRGGFEGFAVVTGFVCAGGAGVALAGDGGLGSGCSGCQEQGGVAEYSEHVGFSRRLKGIIDGRVCERRSWLAGFWL